MKNILVPTDFSPASHNAAKYAVSLAQYFDATIHLLNVIPPQVIMDDYILAPVMTTRAELVTQNTKLMKHEVKTLSTVHLAKISTYLKRGYPSEVIPELAKETDSTLIVMGMKGRGRSNSVFGSTTTTIIRQSTYPVFVIPEEAVFEPIDNITLASGFDVRIEMDRYIVLKTLADKFDSRINILHVDQKDSFMDKEASIRMMETGIAFSRHNYEFHTISESKVEVGINNFIEHNHTDILAMVAQRQPLFERLFGKVHTKVMSYQTEIPLLVLQNK